MAPRTILRDIDAMTEAGLPIIVFQGNRGGIELGFNYRTRLTGLDHDEAEAVGILLATENPMIEALGLSQAARRARAKLIESFPDRVRSVAQRAMQQFRTIPPPTDDDPRIPALAAAVRGQNIVRINMKSKTPQVIHPVALQATRDHWIVADQITGSDIALSACGDINISARRFDV